MGWRGLGKDRRGGVAVLLGGSLFALAGTAAVTVDLGSVYLAKRQLQGVADAAALAASSGGRTAAQAMVDRYGLPQVQLLAVDSGHYAPDSTLQPEQRFLAGDPRATASRIELEQRVPLFFARLLTGQDSLPVRARATAARVDSAAFSIGTGLASISDGLPNKLLSALAGTELNLSVMDCQGLASLDIDLLGFADALRVRTGHGDDAYGALFDRPIPISDLLAAMGDSAGASPTVAVFRAIAPRLGSRSIRLSDIIDLGPMRGAGSAAGQPALLIDALTMLRMVLSPPSGTAVPMDLRLAIPGLASTRLLLVTGPGASESPMMTVTAARDVVVRTAQTRIYLESTVAGALSGLLTLRVPLYVELASAEARLSAIDCTAGSAGSGVGLSVTPSIGTVALADIDMDAVTDFTTAAHPQPALLGQTIGVRVTGFATVPLGGQSPQSVHFTPSEIAANEWKRVSTGDLTQGVAGGIAGRTQIQVSVLGLGIGTSGIAPAVGALLGSIAPLLDNVLNGVTAVMGVRVGSADVRVHAMRCGSPAIVA
ncbi:MAG: pilus assembly protein TadG-related protein [Sphingobium sp.]